MSIYLGTQAYSAVYKGTQAFIKAYQGNQLVFDAGSDLGPDGTTYYVQFVVLASQVGSSLTDFPVYLDMSTLPSNFFSHVNSDGSDIRITSDEGATLHPREVVDIDTGAETGELHFLADLSSSVDNVFRIYYGNASASEPAADSEFGSEAVWAGYTAVFHGGRTENSTGGTNLTAIGAPSVVAGPLGDAYSFNGSNEYLYAFDNLANPSTFNVTMQCWVNGSAQDNQHIFGMGYSSDSDSLFTLASGQSSSSQDTSHVRPAIRDTADTNIITGPTAEALDGTWNKVDLTWNRSSDRAELFVGGLSKGTESESLGAITLNRTCVGALYRGSAEEFFGGLIAEERLTHRILSDDWLEAEYINQGTPLAFYSVGSEQEVGPTPKGDLAVLMDLAGGSPAPDKVVPSGWTEIFSETYSSPLPHRLTISCKRVEPGDTSFPVTGQVGSFVNLKSLLVLHADSDWATWDKSEESVDTTVAWPENTVEGTGSVTTHDVESVAVGVAVAPQTITSGSGSAPLIAMAAYSSAFNDVTTHYDLTASGYSAESFQDSANYSAMAWIVQTDEGLLEDATATYDFTPAIMGSFYLETQE